MSQFTSQNLPIGETINIINKPISESVPIANQAAQHITNNKSKYGVLFIFIIIAFVIIGIITIIMLIFFRDTFDKYSPFTFSAPFGEWSAPFIGLSASSNPGAWFASSTDSSYVGSLYSDTKVSGTPGDILASSMNSSHSSDTGRLMASGSVEINGKNKYVCLNGADHYKSDDCDTFVGASDYFQENYQNNSKSSYHRNQLGDIRNYSENFSTISNIRNNENKSHHRSYENYDGYHRTNIANINNKKTSSFKSDHILDKIKKKRDEYLYGNEGYYDLRGRYMYTLDKPHKHEWAANEYLSKW